MSGNQQKIPLTDSLNRFAENKTADADQLAGKSLPCSVTKVNGAIVTVKFEVTSTNALGATLPPVTVPVEGSEYIRLPIQVGDKGWVKAADAYLGGVSGLGGGVASLVRQGNLAALVFAPIGNTNFAAVSNANAVTIYGVNGNGVTVYSDIKAKAVSIVLTNTNVVISIGTAVSMTLNNSGVQIVGNTSIQGNLSVNGNITVTGTGGGNTISVNGNVELTGAMTATGNITAGTGTGASVSLLGHEHTAPAGGGPTTAPIGGT